MFDSSQFVIYLHDEESCIYAGLEVLVMLIPRIQDVLLVSYSIILEETEYS